MKKETTAQHMWHNIWLPVKQKETVLYADASKIDYKSMSHSFKQIYWYLNNRYGEQGIFTVIDNPSPFIDAITDHIDLENGI